MIVFCLRGQIEVTEASQRLTLESGELLVGNSGQLRSSIYGVDGAECEGVTLIVQPSFLMQCLQRVRAHRLPGRNRQAFLGKIALPELLPLARIAANEMRAERMSQEIALEGAGKLLLAEVLREWPRELVRDRSVDEECYPPRPDFVRAIAYMHTRSQTDFSVARMNFASTPVASLRSFATRPKQVRKSSSFDC